MLRFGYHRGLPAGVQTAWGCRAIVDQAGTVDVVGDRTSVMGPETEVDALLAHLDELPLCGGWQDRARALLRSGESGCRHQRNGERVVPFPARPPAGDPARRNERHSATRRSRGDDERLLAIPVRNSVSADNSDFQRKDHLNRCDQSFTIAEGIELRSGRQQVPEAI